jgi:hypothetical protein
MADTDPAELTSAEARRFLADLAVRKQVSAAAQYQAFNALLFLFPTHWWRCSCPGVA